MKPGLNKRCSRMIRDIHLLIQRCVCDSSGIGWGIILENTVAVRLDAWPKGYLILARSTWREVTYVVKALAGLLEAMHRIWRVAGILYSYR